MALWGVGGDSGNNAPTWLVNRDLDRDRQKPVDITGVLEGSKNATDDLNQTQATSGGWEYDYRYKDNHGISRVRQVRWVATGSNLENTV